MAELALMAVGTGMSVYSTLQEGKAADKASKIEQQQLNAQAEATRKAGQHESMMKRKEGSRLLASQIAQASASGGTFSGSNLLLMANTASEIEKDASMIEYNYGVNARQYESQGRMVRWQGKQAKRASRIRAAAQAFSGASSMYSMTSTPTNQDLALARKHGIR